MCVCFFVSQLHPWMGSPIISFPIFESMLLSAVGLSVWNGATVKGLGSVAGSSLGEQEISGSIDGKERKDYSPCWVG